MAILKNKKRTRGSAGAAMTEFAAGLMIFICFVFVPIIDLAFIPARYMLVHTYLEQVVRKMALAERRSDANRLLNSDSKWTSIVETFGVDLKGARMDLLVLNTNDNSQITLPGLADVPTQWLPSAGNPPCVYALELVCNVDVPPLFKGSGGLPGLTKPIPFTFRNRSQWENLSPDPLTGKYFINE